MSTPDSRPDHAVAAQFDLRARAAYRQSLDQLPASVRGRLRSARGQALSAHSGWRMPRWLPTGLAATAVLAVVAVTGLQQQATTTPETRPIVATPAPAPAAVPDALASTDPELALILDSLDNNPDFYLWLASTDDVTPAER